MKRYKILSLLFLAFFSGLIIASCLDLTQSSDADIKNPAIENKSIPTVTIPNFSSLAESALPAVVNISSTKIVKVPPQAQQMYRFFYWFFPGQRNPNSPAPKLPPEEFKSKSLGSGFIIDNFHFSYYFPRKYLSSGILAFGTCFKFCFHSGVIYVY